MEWGETAVAILALLVASAAFVVSKRTYQASYQPILRVVPTHEGGLLNTQNFVLKNLGRGAAMSIVIAERRAQTPDTFLADVEALEPLGQLYGPQFLESRRVGRTIVNLQHNGTRLKEDTTYRVLYQDVAGDWHETEFKVLADAFSVRLLGPRQREEIPSWVRDRAQIVTGA